MTGHFLSLGAVISVVPTAVIQAIVAAFFASAATVTTSTKFHP